MFAVGHLALGYLSGKAFSKASNVNVNLPLLFSASVISDLDLLIPSLEHRGPTHSIVVLFIIILPVIPAYGKRRALGREVRYEYLGERVKRP